MEISLHLPSVANHIGRCNNSQQRPLRYNSNNNNVLIMHIKSGCSNSN